MLSEKRKRKLILLFYLMPFLVFVLIFSYVPLLGWRYAFFEFTPGLAFGDLEFVGLRYFRVIFDGSTAFGSVMVNTLAISALGLIGSVVPVIFAIMISQMRSSKLSKAVQTICSVPNFISWILVYSIFFSLFSINDGIVNNVLMSLGVISQPTNVLGDAQNAWIIQAIISLWKTTGWSAIIYLAAIAGIDSEQYEAASIDGAGRFQKIIHITLPGLSSTYFVLLLLAIANILSNGFEQYWEFQNALTRERLEVLDTYVYRLGMLNMQYSFATAMGMFRSIISVILLTIANYASRLVRGQSIF